MEWPHVIRPPDDDVYCKRCGRSLVREKFAEAMPGTYHVDDYPLRICLDCHAKLR